MTQDLLLGDCSADEGAHASGDDAHFVNPASGLANDYLNLFNEVVMIIEQLPDMPELFEELLAWRPVTYQDYFEKSALASRGKALDNYARLDPGFRKEFETLVAELDRVAVGSVVALRRIYKKAETAQPGELEDACARHGVSLRALLERAAHLVVHRDAPLARAS